MNYRAMGAVAPNLEERVYPVELRVVRPSSASGGAEAGVRMLVGHAAVFNSASVDLGGFREVVAPGAFAQSIAEDDVRALFNHSPDMVLGRNRSRTLRLQEDARGLAFEIDLPDTQAARDLATSIERGDITGNSFSFQVLEDRWQREGEVELRTLVRVRLFDIGPVTFPAYPQTDVALRSLAAFRAAQDPPAVDPRDGELDILAPGLRGR